MVIAGESSWMNHQDDLQFFDLLRPAGKAGFSLKSGIYDD